IKSVMEKLKSSFDYIDNLMRQYKNKEEKLNNSVTNIKTVMEENLENIEILIESIKEYENEENNNKELPDYS
ncbi:MAG: hypothetical protein ACOCV8_00595, partial [Spirochaetota bacterium]